MNGNIANGGLAVPWKGGVAFAASNEWFLNADDEFVYYCERNDGNRIYRKRGDGGAGSPVVKEPCTRAMLFGEWLYYVNEEDFNVYRRYVDGSGRECLGHAPLGEYGLSSSGEVLAFDGARRLCVRGRSAFFADGANGHVLTAADIPSGERRVFSDVCPAYINLHNDHIYYADRHRENMIYRLDPAGGRVAVYGGSAECLHVIGDSLYFISEGGWKTISLINYGEAKEVI